MSARTAAAAAVLALALSAPATAQTLGVEAGVASVERMGAANLAVGVSLFAPINDRLTGALGYTQWGGDPDEAATGDVPGNRALNAVALVRLFGARGLSGSIGGGIGAYERETASGDDEWQGALTLSALLEQPLTHFVGVYGRADVSGPWDGGGPAWGLFRIGVQARLF